jgi:hypothetical protein
VQVSPCAYLSKRESNCKQPMEKTHGWTYIRSKNNGKNGNNSSASEAQDTKPIYRYDHLQCSNPEDFDHYGGMFLHYQGFHYEDIFCIENLNGIKIDKWPVDRSDNLAYWHYSHCLKRTRLGGDWVCYNCLGIYEPQRIASRQARFAPDVTTLTQLDNMDPPASIITMGNPNIFPLNITKEQHQKLAALPPDKLNEVIGKWKERNNGQYTKRTGPILVMIRCLLLTKGYLKLHLHKATWLIK